MKNNVVVPEILHIQGASVEPKFLLRIQTEKIPKEGSIIVVNTATGEELHPVGFDLCGQPLLLDKQIEEVRISYEEEPQECSYGDLNAIGTMRNFLKDHALKDLVKERARFAKNNGGWLRGEHGWLLFDRYMLLQNGGVLVIERDCKSENVRDIVPFEELARTEQRYKAMSLPEYLLKKGYSALEIYTGAYELPVD